MDFNFYPVYADKSLKINVSTSNERKYNHIYICDIGMTIRMMVDGKYITIGNTGLQNIILSSDSTGLVLKNEIISAIQKEIESELPRIWRDIISLYTNNIEWVLFDIDNLI